MNRLINILFSFFSNSLDEAMVININFISLKIVQRETVL